MVINPLNHIDFYKADHRRQYPIGTQMVYSNFTARKSKTKSNSIVFFGLQYFLKEYLIDQWKTGFFNLPKDIALKQYKRRMDHALGKDSIDVEHIGALHDIGYLPIEIRAISEGTLVSCGIPVLTICNTDERFFWLTNYLETILSCSLWKACTSATTAFQYRIRFEEYKKYTVADVPAFDLVKWQGHDFSFRGMSSLEDACISGAAHLTSFTGTDTVAAIDFVEKYYNADCEKELIGGSVPATEHSVMCMGGKETEIETFRRLLKLYPTGILSVVSDTWDFWKVVTEILPALKKEIMERNGKLVIRPDSGDPVKIICGDPDSDSKAARDGAIETLWNIFGGTKTEKGFKQLDSHIGLIYGDSITLERQQSILMKLANAGFSSFNIVLGVGSFTYQYVTRDTYGFAVKSTWGMINGQPQEIFKDPKTDDGTKKSLCGLINVTMEDGKLIAHDHQVEARDDGELKPVFVNGKLLVDHKLSEIRERIDAQCMKLISSTNL